MKIQVPLAALKRNNAVENEHVLFILSPCEKQWFFPCLQASDIPAPFSILDSGMFDAADYQEILRETHPSVIVTCWSTPRLPVGYLDDKDMRLRYICNVTGSVRAAIPREFVARGVRVTNWGGIVAAAVAEHALLLALASLRSLPRWRECLLTPYDKQDEFRISLKTRSLSGQRVGLFGFGQIARKIVQLLRPFNVPIWAYSEGVPAEYMDKFGVTACDSIEQLFSTSTVLFACEALNPRTVNAVTGALLDRLPQQAVFINVGRGRTIDEKALVERAAQGKIRIATDVYACEPLPLDAPILSLQEAVLSPHIAGPTHDLYPICGAFALENIRRYMNAQPLEALITPDVYDRST